MFAFAVMLLLATPARGQLTSEMTAAEQAGQASGLLLKFAGTPAETMRGERGGRDEASLPVPLRQAWARAQLPVRIGSRLWLTLSPSSLNLTQPTSTADTAVLLCRPSIWVRDEPLAGQAQNSPMITYTPTRGQRLHLTGELPFSFLQAAFEKSMARQRFDLGDGRSWSVVGVALGERAGAFAMKVSLKGASSATLLLVGHPVFDLASQALRVPDLSVESIDGSEFSAEVLEKFRKRIAGNPVWTLSTDFQYTEKIAAISLQHALGRGSKASVSDLSLDNIVVKPKGLFIAASMTASVELPSP